MVYSKCFPCKSESITAVSGERGRRNPFVIKQKKHKTKTETPYPPLGSHFCVSLYIHSLHDKKVVII